jgi:drug/metabolite transporter (DMT)-like permease
MTLARIAPVLFVLLWSTGWVSAKYATFFADPLTFLLVRYGTAVVLFYIVCRVGGVSWPKDRAGWMHAIISGMFLHGLYLGMVWWAIGQGVPAALSGIIAGLQPLMTGVAAAYLIGEDLSASQRLGLVIGFLGVGIAVLPKVLVIDASTIPAYAVAVNVLAMACVTAGTIYQKRLVKEGDLRAVATLQYVGALIVTVPAAVALENLHVDWSLGFFATLAWRDRAASLSDPPRRRVEGGLAHLSRSAAGGSRSGHRLRGRVDGADDGRDLSGHGRRLPDQSQEGIGARVSGRPRRP